MYLSFSLANVDVFGNTGERKASPELDKKLLDQQQRIQFRPNQIRADQATRSDTGTKAHAPQNWSSTAASYSTYQAATQPATWQLR